MRPSKVRRNSPDAAEHREASAGTDHLLDVEHVGVSASERSGSANAADSAPNERRRPTGVPGDPMPGADSSTWAEVAESAGVKTRRDYFAGYAQTGLTTALNSGEFNRSKDAEVRPEHDTDRGIVAEPESTAQEESIQEEESPANADLNRGEEAEGRVAGNTSTSSPDVRGGHFASERNQSGRTGRVRSGSGEPQELAAPGPSVELAETGPITAVVSREEAVTMQWQAIAADHERLSPEQESAAERRHLREQKEHAQRERSTHSANVANPARSEASAAATGRAVPLAPSGEVAQRPLFSSLGPAESPLAAVRMPLAWKWAAALAVASLILLLAKPYLGSSGHGQSLGVTATDTNGRVQLHWDPSQDVVRSAQGGLLDVMDGTSAHRYPVDTKVLASGSLDYIRHSDDATVTLTLYADGQPLAQAAVRSIGPVKR